MSAWVGRDITFGNQTLRVLLGGGCVVAPREYPLWLSIIFTPHSSLFDKGYSKGAFSYPRRFLLAHGRGHGVGAALALA